MPDNSPPEDSEESQTLTPGLYKRDDDTDLPENFEAAHIEEAIEQADAVLVDMEDREEILQVIPTDMGLFADSSYTRNRLEWELLSNNDDQDIPDGEVLTQVGIHVRTDQTILDLRRTVPNSFASFLGA